MKIIYNGSEEMSTAALPYREVQKAEMHGKAVGKYGFGAFAVSLASRKRVAAR